MKNELRPSARNVQQWLEAQGFAFEVVELPASTRTAREAARAIGCTTPQIAKSLVFRGEVSGDPVLAITGGANRVDTEKLAALTGEPVGKADAAYVRRRTGYAIGGVPPVAHAERIRTFIDADLLRHEVIWAAAGTPNAVFRLRPTDLPELTGGVVAEFKA